MKPVKVTLPGWTEDITKCKEYNQLPLKCREYIEFIEKELETPITWIGTGPEREGLILKQE